jgi:phosphoenolpyruvate synthase/pyruvate phosphate dikinase
MHGIAALEDKRMLIDLTKPGQVTLNQVGGKAFNLHKLTNMGVPVPPALVIPASVQVSLAGDTNERLRSQLLQHEIVMSGDSFAVRSSGVGEDGEGNSCAGIFESYLNVPKDEIHDAVVRVWDSLNNARSAMYANERSISIDTMGVVVQHMIDADYAGVAFSVCPIEKDDRIALLEVVRGCGDSLVSGEKTPATLRINKLTGMVRISRNGVDNFSEDTLESMADKLLPFIEKIEDEYQMPVDIEWAIAQGNVYILQARPITT